MASHARDPALCRAERAERCEPARRRMLPAALLLPCVAILCGASWEGRYTGNDAGAHVLVLDEHPGGLSLDLEIAVGNASQCQIRVDDCPAVVEEGGFRAGPCQAKLAGTEGATCTGAVDLHLQGSELASNGGRVSSLRLRTTLNDWPVVLERRTCGLGAELVALLPLLRLARRRRRLPQR